MRGVAPAGSESPAGRGGLAAGRRLSPSYRKLPVPGLSFRVERGHSAAMLLLTTGGTIDKVYFDAASEFEVGESTVPQIFEDTGARLDYEHLPLFRKDSLEMTEEDREAVRRACLETGHRQILITHGTDTMAETAERLRGIPGKVIVLTGAMAPARFRVTDAIFNLGVAVGALQALPEGAYVAMNGHIFEAGKVRKDREAGRFVKAGDFET